MNPTAPGIRIGYSQSGQVLRFKGTSHLATFASTGAGKTSQAIIPALLDWPNSAIVIDVKAEIAAVCGQARKRFGRVLYLNPFDALKDYLKRLGLKKVRYNPMVQLDPNARHTFGPRAAKLSDAIVWQGAGQERYWASTSKQLTQVFMMALAKHGAPHERNLGTLARIIGGDSVGFARHMMAQTDDPILRGKLARYAMGTEGVKSLGEVVQNTITETDFLTEEAIADSLSDSDFSFADLKREVITVFIILPLEFIDIAGKYFRLLLGSALSELLREEGPDDVVPTLIVADEAYQLGRLEVMDKALGMARGFHTQIWTVWNDIGQMRSLYPDTFETYINNSGVVMWMAARDQQGSRYVSDQCGETEVRTEAKSVSWPAGVRDEEFNPQINVNHSKVPRKLILPHEVRFNLPPF